MPWVTAILVAREGDAAAEHALARQTRRPDAVVTMTAGSSIEHLVAGIPPAHDDEWLWLLPGSAEPEPDALARLLGAVEVAPSVVIAGPKLVDPDDRARLRSYGESVTRYGTTVPLADDELDQSQHDAQDDVLGVVLPGMLVRRALWEQLGGPDHGLPTVDAGLDLSIRARLAGGRVVRVAGARVAVAEGAQDFLRRKPLGAGGRERAARAAQLHRRMAYAPEAAVPLHWFSLLPLAVLRSLGLLLAKRPGSIPAEIAAAFVAVFDGSVPAARGVIRRTRRVGWAALAPLRVPPEVVRERRATARDRDYARSGLPDLVRAGFLPGGLAVTLVATVLGVLLSLRLLGATALTGGALLPLSSDLGALWAAVAWGPRDGLGLPGPADPFHAVLALLGSLTPWNPSLALVLLWVAAPGLAALAAWWCTTRLTTRAWPPVLAAALWVLAPPFLAALIDGRPAAVLVHVLLPWLLLAVLGAPRSWSAAGAASLLLAAVVACAPSLAPVLVLGIAVWAFTHPRALVRILAILLPAAALAAPLVVTQFARGTPLALFADPGATVPFAEPSGWQLLLGSPTAGGAGWPQLVDVLGLPALVATPAAIALLAPVAGIVLLAPFLPGGRRALPSAALALGGLLTAVVASHLAVATTGGESVGIWPGAGLSLYWAGLLGAIAVALGSLRRGSVAVGVAVLVSAGLAVSPSLVTLVTGAGAVAAGDGRVQPAIVVAEAANDPGLGVLVLRPQQDGSLAASVERGAGTTLDRTSTLAATQPQPTAAHEELAELAGNLASRGGYDPAPVLARLGIEFVLLTPAGDGAAGIRQRAAEALDAQAVLDAVGDTARGSLWRYPDHEATPPPVATSPAGTLALAVQIAVVAFAVLLALPTGRRRRPVAATPGDDLAEGYEGDGFENDGFDEEHRG